MENKHKNALIGGLLAIIFIMAVGFAGFTQQLTINDTSSVTTTWNVGFDSVTPSAVCPDSDATAACGKVNNFTAGDKALVFDTKLMSPSDTVTYTVVVKNYGDVDAKIATNGISMTETNTDSVISYAQSGLTEGDTLAAGATKTFTVTVSFDQTGGQIDTNKLTNGLAMYIDWEQA